MSEVHIPDLQVKMGCDPELFLMDRSGEVVGAERVIPEDGIETLSVNEHNRLAPEGRKGIVLDGVQIELNPKPCHCRALLGNEISAAFKTLKEHLSKTGFQASFAQCVEVSQTELDGLSEKSKLLGCAPSNNLYDLKATIGVNPATYRTRSAGGHLHYGLNGYPGVMAERERAIPLLDILVGNTAVLMDRDPGNATRRKVYGRAGEYRLPKHGLEYRTLSNFWLRSYPLMSAMLAQSRLALGALYVTQLIEAADAAGATNPSVLAEYRGKDKPETVLLDFVDLKSVQTAINDNDVELAKKNFEGVKTFISKFNLQHNGINVMNVSLFEHFVKRIDEKGLGYWFPDDPMEFWTHKYIDGHGYGWESFLSGPVAKDVLKGD